MHGNHDDWMDCIKGSFWRKRGMNMSEYPEGTVTISLDEYRDLCEMNARASVLRMHMVKELEKRIDMQKTHTGFVIEHTTLDACDVSNIMGFYSTFHGFLEKENELNAKMECEEE